MLTNIAFQLRKFEIRHLFKVFQICIKYMSNNIPMNQNLPPRLCVVDICLFIGVNVCIRRKTRPKAAAAIMTFKCRRVPIKGKHRVSQTKYFALICMN